MTKLQPDPGLQPSEAISEILAEIQRYSEAIGLVDLVAGLNAEADSASQRIIELEADYAAKLRTGLQEVEAELAVAREKAESEKRGYLADTNRARHDLKVLLREIDEIKAAEEERVDELRIERTATQAARKALASERTAFEGDQRRLNRSR